MRLNQCIILSFLFLFLVLSVITLGDQESKYLRRSLAAIGAAESGSVTSDQNLYIKNMGLMYNRKERERKKRHQGKTYSSAEDVKDNIAMLTSLQVESYRDSGST